MKEDKNINIKKHLWENKLRYFAGLFVFFVLSVITVTIPRISGRIVDNVEIGALEPQQLLLLCLQIVGLALAVVLCNFLARVFILSSVHRFDMENRNKIFKYLLKLSMRYYNKNSVGDIMALSTNDLRAIRMSMMRTIMMTGRGLFTIGLSFIAMTQIASLKLALIVMIPFPFLVLLTIKLGPIMRGKFRTVQDTFAGMTSKTQENVSGIRVIKAFVQEEAEINNFKEINQKYFDDNKNMIKTSSTFHSVAGLLIASSFLLLFAAGGTMVVNGGMSTGDYVVAVQYIGNMIRPFMMIGMMVEMIQQGKASYTRINNFLDEPVDIKENVDKDDFINSTGKHGIEGHIKIDNLTFKYEEDSEPVLKNISLTLDPGETLGVIGKIGSGKSTLGLLLMRLYHAESGMIKVDGYNIEDLPVDILRQNIGYIPQQNFLFSDSIAENVGFSPEELDEEKVVRSIRLAQIEDAVMDLEYGVNTELGEKGVNLSGGQKQRLSIARALYRNPSILIVDDALSAVDTETEARILEQLKPFTQDITTVIIAHRVSTIEHADVIIVLDEGRIVEKGTHEELIAKKGEYYDIYNRQQLSSKSVGGDV